MAFILIAEDDPISRSILANALRRAGHEVESAPDGRLAVEAFGRGLHDLVITDIFMPELDGIGTIQQLRRIRSTLPIIAISETPAQLDNDYLETARMLGAAQTFRKPIECSALLATIETLLGDPGSGARPFPARTRPLRTPRAGVE